MFRRFARSRSVGAHFGLTPRKWQSGEIDHMGQISKCGDVMMRTALYDAAHSMLTRTTRWSWRRPGHANCEASRPEAGEGCARSPSRRDHAPDVDGWRRVPLEPRRPRRWGGDVTREDTGGATTKPTDQAKSSRPTASGRKALFKTHTQRLFPQRARGSKAIAAESLPLAHPANRDNVAAP